MKSYRSYQDKRSNVFGKMIIGIDPGKGRHQAVIIDSAGIPTGKSFSFSVSYDGFRKKLWEEINKQLVNYTSSELLFAVEASCNLWQTISSYLRLEGYDVVLVSPMCTKQSRVMLNNDFSKTDHKDALLIALHNADIISERTGEMKQLEHSYMLFKAERASKHKSSNKKKELRKTA